jgi:mono/diheme cytochrome c family protein
MRSFAFLAALLFSVPVVAQAASDADLYKRCAQCHLPSGAGVPGTFPPLDPHLGKIAASPEGRAYLILVATQGLSGQLKVGNQVYRNIMPAQNLNAADTAAVLNYILNRFSSGGLPQDWKPITEAEVSEARSVHAGAKAPDLHKLREKALEGK